MYEFESRSAASGVQCPTAAHSSCDEGLMIAVTFMHRASAVHALVSAERVPSMCCGGIPHSEAQYRVAMMVRSQAYLGK